MIDGYILVYYHRLEEPEKFPFSEMKSWYWSTQDTCNFQAKKDVLIIAREKSRTEIPRASIRKVECVYNDPEEMVKEVENFANGGHDGTIHPGGD